MGVNVESFSFSWCSTGGPGVHSAGCWLSLLHLISNFSGPQAPSGFPRAPSAGYGFPYHTSSITPSPTVTASLTQLSWLLSWLSYIIVHRPLDLWNRMFNRHQAEITVIQFRGHSLPMRQSMRVSWDFLACPILLANFHPRDFSSPNCHWNVSLPSGASPWMAFKPGRRSKYNTIPSQIYRIYFPEKKICSSFSVY